MIANSLVDLPRETQEQGANLRRAISDQSRALSELSNILVSAGRSTDVAKPVMAAPAPAPVATRQEPAYVAPVQTIPTVPVEPIKTEFKVPAVAARELPKPAPAAPEIGIRQDAKPSPTPAGDKSQRAGWLSDLLDRASQDEGKVSEEPEAAMPLAKPKAPAVVEAPKVEVPKEAISALLSDIAKLVDESAVARLWNSYLKGESAAFSKSIYTLEGQRRFEELTALHSKDDRFRASLEAYASKFEAVLRDLTTSDQDGAITRSILASPEGRVYTVLAHVSRRLG